MNPRNKLATNPVSDRPGRRAVLVDLENLCFTAGAMESREVVERRLGALLQACGPAEFFLAVAPVSVVRRNAAALAAHGLRWEVCPAGPDSADHRIVEVARDLVDRGFTEIAVLSADHYFARIAAWANLTVATPIECPPARVLRAAASGLVAA